MFTMMARKILQRERTGHGFSMDTEKKEELRFLKRKSTKLYSSETKSGIPTGIRASVQFQPCSIEVKTNRIGQMLKWVFKAGEYLLPTSG